MTDDRFVYSTDPEENREIQRQDAARKSKSGGEPVDTAAFIVSIGLDRKGRRGKAVTVASGFPANGPFLKTLTQRLKKACGTGGTFRIVEERGHGVGVIEIQGDRREDVRTFLARDGIGTR